MIQNAHAKKADVDGLVIWLGLYPARRQILWRRSWVLSCPDVQLSEPGQRFSVVMSILVIISWKAGYSWVGMPSVGLLKLLGGKLDLIAWQMFCEPTRLTIAYCPSIHVCIVWHLLLATMGLFTGMDSVKSLQIQHIHKQTESDNCRPQVCSLVT